MTVEECAQSIVDEAERAFGATFPDRDSAIESISCKLRALLYTESERAAAICLEVRNQYGDDAVASRAAQMACEVCQARILRTSQGKAKQDCPDCEGAGRHADPMANEWYSDSSDECGQCKGTGKILATSPGKVGA